MTIRSKSTLSHQLRIFDQTLRETDFQKYVSLITVVMEDYPASVSAHVRDLLQSRDFGTLLEWADSYGGAKHSTAEDSFSANQLTALIKKYPFPARELKKFARAKATEKFWQSEFRCRKYNLKFHLREIPRWDPDSDILQRMSGWIRYVIGDQPDKMRIYGECGFGPGASIGVHGQNTNLARKLLSKSWSCTPSALPYAVSALAQDQHIWELLNPDVERPVCFDYDVFRKGVLSKVQLVHNNKIVFVPKTTIVDRTIAIEPLLNGYLQKGVDNVMRQQLKRVGLDLSDQGRNQELARLGSLPNQDDPFVTIDLSSASDSISTAVVRRLLPPEWFEFLNALRSKKFELDGVIYNYEKFTSMGNGFCFPLETLIFASVCRLYAKPGDFIVYGDDIICRQSVSSEVIKTLWKLGFRHNPDKTFLFGPFRESCGADWHSGLDIRPLTLDYALDSAENIIKFHNMSMRKPLWAHAFRKVRELLLEWIPPSLRLMRPFGGVEYSAFEVPFDVFMSSPFARFDRKIWAWSWMEICRSATPDRGCRSEDRYSTVLMMGALSGSTSHCPFAVRRKTSRTVRRMSHAGASSLWLPLSDDY